MSIEINISNYEEYALDYLEGTLSGEVKNSFDGFLALNPDIAAEINEMREVESLDSDYALSPEFKASLKVEVGSDEAITSDNYEEVFVLSVDQELDPKLEAALPEFLENNQALKADYELYQKAVLSSDSAIVYPGKGALKQAVPLWDSAAPVFMRVAAILIVLLGTFTIWNAVQNEVYIPRNESLEFSLMDESLPLPVQETATTPVETESIASQEKSTSNATKGARVTRQKLEPVSKMQTIASNISPQSEPAQFETREVVAYNPSVPQGLESRIENRAEPSELTLAQFVGQRFLGVEPNKAPTAGALIREGAIQAIDSRDNMSLSASAPKDEKKTIQFLAGNFEFKRVNYK